MSSRKTETRGRRRSRFLPVLLLTAALAACGGASGAALDRGDKYAEGGLWGKAAAEYEQALKLDPENTDAAIKLKQARAKMSAERLVRGKSLIQRGEIEQGLAA